MEIQINHYTILPFSLFLKLMQGIAIGQKIMSDVLNIYKIFMYQVFSQTLWIHVWIVFENQSTMRKISVLKAHTCLYTYRHVVNSSLNKHQIGKELVLWYRIRDGKLFHIIYLLTHCAWGTLWAGMRHICWFTFLVWKYPHLQLLQVLLHLLF